MIYLNNPATTWPKPEPVCKAIDDAARHMSSPSRTHSAEGAKTANAMEQARATIAAFLGIDNPSRLALMPGCTYAANAAIQGLAWEDGDVAVMSGLEHHASSRAVRLVAGRRDITFQVAPYKPGDPLDLQYVEDQLKHGNVRVVLCTMAANVTGEILPYQALATLCKRYGTTLMLDAAQAAGVLDFKVREIDPDIMVFAGHKGLYGPTGIGGSTSVKACTSRRSPPAARVKTRACTRCPARCPASSRSARTTPSGSPASPPGSNGSRSRPSPRSGGTRWH